LAFLGDARLPSDFQERILAETRIVRCSGDFCVKRSVPIAYPPLAKQAQITGKVRLHFSIDTLGKARETEAEGHPFLRAPALAAFEQFVFENSASGVRHEVTIEFQLSGGPQEPGSTVFEEFPPSYYRVFGRNVWFID
jgi:hypothetical protein